MVPSHEEEKRKFEEIAGRMSKLEDVELGKMMSSPGIRYRDKVFAFYHDKKMIFKLGKGFDIASFGIDRFSYLNPFKDKGPMLGWYEIPFEYSGKWEELTKLALGYIREELKNKK